MATITSDNISVNASVLGATPNSDELTDMVNTVNEEFLRLMEQNAITKQIRQFTRDAAVDGDGCLYTYWDGEAETGQQSKGMIHTEVVDNTRVIFGDPNTQDVQSQPYIQIEIREFTRRVKKEAKANGVSDWAYIKSDEDSNQAIDSVKRTDGKCSVILTLWRDEEDGKIWAYKSTKDVTVKEPWCLDIKLYPVVWLNWDAVKNCYHGEAMITGLIPNQILVNQMWACSGTALKRIAWPKVMFDSTRIKKWDNRPGGAIGVPGGDMNTAVRIVDPPQISPQAFQFPQILVEDSEKSMGATAVALGDTRPDNTSAIIALQRAASTPIENTKQNLYQAIEDLFKIYLEFMANYYGKRMVDLPMPQSMVEAYQFAGMQNIPDTIAQEFDFGVLVDHPMTIQLDVGASSYYSEIASMQTLDNLLQLGHITIDEYLERVPDGYIRDRRGLLEKKKTQMAMQQAMMQPPMPPEGGGDVEGEVTEMGIPDEIPTGGGYSALQRKVIEQL